MNISTRTRLAGATATLGMLLAFTACGNETVSDTDPGTQSAAHPKVIKSGGTVGSADGAERRAAADKARQDRASTLRWARGSSQENKLKQAGHPGQP